MKYKKALKYLFLAPILMAFQCDDEIESSLKFNKVIVKVTSKSTFSINDTVWIKGRVSSKVFDLSVNDSIFNNKIQSSSIKIFKFISSNEVSNTKEAIDNFELIFDKGNYSFFDNCINGQMFVIPELENNNLFYTYRLGLRTKFKGDFMISFLDNEVQNLARNQFIAEEYPIERFPNQIGFDQCGTVSWISIEDSKKEYLFKVE